MKGLLKNNFMGLTENIKILFPLLIILGSIVLVTGDASLLSIYSLSVTPILFLSIRSFNIGILVLLLIRMAISLR